MDEDDDPVSDGAVEQATPSRWRRWLAWTAALVVAMALTPVVAVGGVVSPFLRDDLTLDRVVRAVALDWRDFGRARAEMRLQYELDREGIGLQVADSDCSLTEDGPSRVVACSWVADVRIPGVAAPVSLPFSSRAEITADGDLR